MQIATLSDLVTRTAALVCDAVPRLVDRLVAVRVAHGGPGGAARAAGAGPGHGAAPLLSFESSGKGWEATLADALRDLPSFVHAPTLAVELSPHAVFARLVSTERCAAYLVADFVADDDSGGAPGRPAAMSASVGSRAPSTLTFAADGVRWDFYVAMATQCSECSWRGIASRRAVCVTPATAR